MDKRLFLLLAILVIVLTIASIAYTYFYMVLPYPRARFESTPIIIIDPHPVPLHECLSYTRFQDFVTSDSAITVQLWLENHDWQVVPEGTSEQVIQMYYHHVYKGNGIVFAINNKAQLISTPSITELLIHRETSICRFKSYIPGG